MSCLACKLIIPVSEREAERGGGRGVQATLYKQEISFVMQLAIYQLAFKKPLKPNPTNAKKAVNKRGKNVKNNF